MLAMLSGEVRWTEMIARAGVARWTTALTGENRNRLARVNKVWQTVSTL